MTVSMLILYPSNVLRNLVCITGQLLSNCRSCTNSFHLLLLSQSGCIISTGDFIDVIHKKWWGKHEHLEYNHSYIQWLFPIRERGLNMYADELQLHEAEVKRILSMVMAIVIKILFLIAGSTVCCIQFITPYKVCVQLLALHVCL